ncbi:ras protein, partial [Mycena pura]
MHDIKDEWRVVVLGDTGVGKTALAFQVPPHLFMSTYGYIDLTLEGGHRKAFVVDNRTCYLEVIDAPGRASIVSRSTFDRLEVFNQAVRRAEKQYKILLLVGNKADMAYAREVSTEEGAALARQFGCEFFETSAKTAQNLEPVFTNLVRALRQTRNLEPTSETNSQRAKEREKKKCIIL